MRFLHTLFRFTLSSVIFGIALLFLITLYVAIGSGFPAVRAYFEMNDLEFFNAWPLKLLMLLLCVTLATVTANRIPLTPPRYGVWCIHSGIITLILGMAPLLPLQSRRQNPHPRRPHRQRFLRFRRTPYTPAPSIER